MLVTAPSAASIESLVRRPSLVVNNATLTLRADPLRPNMLVAEYVIGGSERQLAVVLRYDDAGDLPDLQSASLDVLVGEQSRCQWR